MSFKKLEFYLPRNPLTPYHELFTKVLDRFGGATEQVGVGTWVSPSGVKFTEGVYILSVFFDATPSNMLYIETLALEYMRSAKQQSILYAVDNQPIFIEEEDYAR